MSDGADPECFHTSEQHDKWFAMNIHCFCVSMDALLNEQAVQRASKRRLQICHISFLHSLQNYFICITFYNICNKQTTQETVYLQPKLSKKWKWHCIICPLFVGISTYTLYILEHKKRQNRCLKLSFISASFTNISFSYATEKIKQLF